MKTIAFLLIGIVVVAAVTECNDGDSFDDAAVAGGGTFRLHNHPDGSARPPLYGLRLDGLHPGQSKIVSFDFDASQSKMLMTWEPSAKTLRIYGKMIGGPDTGSNYAVGFPHEYTIDFLYTDVEIRGSSPSRYLFVDRKNTDVGIIRDVTDGVNYNLVSSDMVGSFFKVKKGHRGYAQYSGWGWLDHSNKDHIAASDWLFTMGVCENDKKACCLQGQCSVKTLNACAADGGVSLQDDACSPGICPSNDQPGACCTAIEGCKDGQTSSSCNAPDQFYAFRDCASLETECPYNIGACCKQGSPCIENSTPTGCALYGGSFHFGKTCAEKCPECNCREFVKSKSCGDSSSKSPSRCICLEIKDDETEGQCTESDADGRACPAGP